MRASVTLDDHTYESLRQKARALHIPLKDLLTAAVRQVLAADEPAVEPVPFTLRTIHSGLKPGVTVATALAVVDESDDRDRLER